MIHTLKSTIKSVLNGAEGLINRFLPPRSTMAYMDYVLVYNRGNSLIKRLKREGKFENNLIDRMKQDLFEIEHPLLLDIGSNIGLMSLALKRGIPSLAIHAFEPGPVQRQALEKTITVNNLSDIKVHPYALSDSSGIVDFHTHHGGDQAKDGIKDTKRGTATFTVPVEMKTLDEWWTGAGKPKIDAIKIDTEGAELLVLKGGTECLTTLHPIIYLEIEPRNFIPYGYTAEDVYAQLKALGYTIEQLPGSEDTFIAKVR